MSQRDGRVVVKRRCCDDRPRCRSCPNVWQRLVAAGWAEAVTRREYHVAVRVPAEVVKLARKGKPRALPRPERPAPVIERSGKPQVA